MRSLVAGMPNDLPETLSADILQRYKLMNLQEALFNIHLPADENLLQRAVLRLKFEELFYLQLRLLRAKIGRQIVLKGKQVG